jgi:hypothetical protein
MGHQELMVSLHNMSHWSHLEGMDFWVVIWLDVSWHNLAQKVTQVGHSLF